MELILTFLAIAIVLASVEYQIQMLKEEITKINQIETKKKQFTREHMPISKTNFRKHFKRSNRCVCKIQKQ